MFELWIGGISLAIAVGQVYGAPKVQQRKTAFMTALVGCALIIGLAGIRYYESFQEDARIERLASRILGFMVEPQTFEDIYDKLDGKDRDLVDRAFNRLDDREQSAIRKVQVHDPEGRPHQVRLFSKR